MAVVYPWEPPAEPNPMLEAALSYARLGIPVFPTHGVRNGACSCGSPDCASPAKHPATPHGWHDATTDEARIRAWWGKTHYLNIARPTGDTIVLDVDPRNGGTDSLDRLETRYGKLPDTWHVLTGGSGQHFSFALPPGTKLKTAHPISPAFPGIDLQASGAYVLLPPSVHISGRTYAAEASSDLLEGQGIAPAPGWLINLCELHREADRSPEPVDLHAAFPSELADARAALANLDPDCGYDTWLRIGQALHSTCWQEAFALWRDWSAEGAKWCGDTELRKKWRSFDANRSAQVTINTLYWEAKQAGARSTDDSGISPKAETEQPEQPSPSWLVFAGDLMAERHTVRWTVNQIIPGDSLGQIFGAAGSGKSFFHLDLGLHIAHGLAWNDHKTEPGGVLMVAGEGFFGLPLRLHAWARHHKQTLSGIPYLISRTSVPIADMKAITALRDEILTLQDKMTHPLRWIVIDTLNRNFGHGDENSTQDMSRFIDGMAWLREQLQTGVCSIHHSGHLESTRARGSSALYGALDYEIKISRDKAAGLMTASCTKMKDAEEWGDIYFETKPMATPITDDEGAIQTSLVIVKTEKPSAASTPTGQLAVAVEIAHQLASEYRARLQAQDLPVPNPTLVPLEDVRNAYLAKCENAESGRRSWNRLKEQLVQTFGGELPLKVKA